METVKEYSQFEKKFADLTAKSLENSPYGVYDLKYISGSSTLRLFILKDKSVEVGINDCVAVDRMLTEEIEAAEWIPDSFVLEVSSPGVYRDINAYNHFQLALGERVTLNLFKQGAEELGVKGNKLSGILKEAAEDKVIVDTEKEQITVPFSVIKKAKVDPKFEDLKNKGSFQEIRE